MRVALVYKNFAAHAGISHIGLGVSAAKNAEYLISHGIDAQVIAAKNNVEIVEAIRERGPFTHVIISAAWLSPLDVDTMVRHFSKIQFAIISHSNVGFLQADPGAFKLLRAYVAISKEVPNLAVGGNSEKFARWFAMVYETPKLTLPNLYPFEEKHKHFDSNGPVIRIGSFGAIRPQKNVLTAGAAAMWMSKHFGIPVEFNVSTGREDGGGNVILNALRQMSTHVPGFYFVERHWSDWHDFRRVVRKMDLLMQVSYTESFNMVTADGVMEGIPSVVSDSIYWAPESWKAPVDDVEKIAHTGVELLISEHKRREGAEALHRHNRDSFHHWFKFLSEASV